MRSCSHDHRANEEYDVGDEQCPFSAYLFRNYSPIISTQRATYVAFSIPGPTKEAKNGTEKGSRLERRRNVTGDAVGIGRRNVKVFFETGASDCRPNECTVIAKAVYHSVRTDRMRF